MGHLFGKGNQDGVRAVSARVRRVGVGAAERAARIECIDPYNKHVEDPALRFLLFLVVLSILSLLSPARANDAPVQLRSGGAAPEGMNLAIRMDSEEVTICLLDRTYTVDAVFHFFNTADTTTEWVGFPKRLSGYLSDFHNIPEFIKFETWVEGQKVAVSEEPDISSIMAPHKTLGALLKALKKPQSSSLLVKDFRWLVKRVRFPGHTTVTTRIRYEAPYSATAEVRRAFYVYGTGSYWKGNIGRATFTIDSTAIGGSQPIRADFSHGDINRISEPEVSGKVMKFELKDFKPKPDAELSIQVPHRQSDLRPRNSPLWGGNAYFVA